MTSVAPFIPSVPAVSSPPVRAVTPSTDEGDRARAERTEPRQSGQAPASQTSPSAQSAESNGNSPFVNRGPFTFGLALGLAFDQATSAEASPQLLSELSVEGAASQLDADQDAGGANDGPNELTEAEEKLVRQLQQRDREARAHEQAHAAAGGQYAGAPTYTYQRGPGGKQYAIGGAVSIDTSPIAGDPEATIRKLETVIRAATAPSEPSSIDQRVASQARADLAQARIEAAQQPSEEEEGGTSNSLIVPPREQSQGEDSASGTPRAASTAFGQAFASQVPAEVFSIAV